MTDDPISPILKFGTSLSMIARMLLSPVLISTETPPAAAAAAAHVLPLPDLRRAAGPAQRQEYLAPLLRRPRPLLLPLQHQSVARGLHR